eukprot:CAMPEP_0175056332 /NCGR_PEP_ID=MMETSP0052_2-20121109/10608_1 /TAXON_ID=51329 ORGANISM="Polytomella parva, Strain SAG 63-3" /NCGR_SAMPLE_ID=MMETSP0052_2 /ASSEMBLY_ACC=CAM_ASM_000194 /LENGTH=125 /DNA_ID=CAMNT_0016321339 /DNA_START=59 /DNA_END=432 /DNA_ORIENTATION=-
MNNNNSNNTHNINNSNNSNNSNINSNNNSGFSNAASSSNVLSHVNGSPVSGFGSPSSLSSRHSPAVQQQPVLYQTHAAAAAHKLSRAPSRGDPWASSTSAGDALRMSQGGRMGSTAVPPLPPGWR